MSVRGVYNYEYLRMGIRCWDDRANDAGWGSGFVVLVMSLMIGCDLRMYV